MDSLITGTNIRRIRRFENAFWLNNDLTVINDGGEYERS